MPCSGCTLNYGNWVYSDRSLYSVMSGSVSAMSPWGYTPRAVVSTAIYADGLGSLSGISGYNLGTLTINVENRYSGQCQNTTGIQIVGVSGGNTIYDDDMTGAISHVYVTGCNQRTPCRIGKLWIEFSGNSDLYAGVPSARTSIYALVYSAGNPLFPIINYDTLSSGNRNLVSGALSMTNTRIDCGNTYSASIVFQTLIPGQTGIIKSYCDFGLFCTSCNS